jgi:hypothetical protein
MPREVARILTAGVPHVGFCPLPETVELFLLIQLNGDHHAIRHAFRTDIPIVDIEDVCHIVANRIVNPFRIVVAIKQRLPDFIDARLNVFIGQSDFAQHVRILPCEECPVLRRCLSRHRQEHEQ